MKFIILQVLMTTIAVIALAYQAATSVFPDIGYILGLAVLLLTLLTGFAKLVSQNAEQKKDIVALTQAVAKLDKKDDEMRDDIKSIENKVQGMEKQLIRMER